MFVLVTKHISHPHVLYLGLFSPFTLILTFHDYIPPGAFLSVCLLSAITGFFFFFVLYIPEPRCNQVYFVLFLVPHFNGKNIDLFVLNVLLVPLLVAIVFWTPCSMIDTKQIVNEPQVYLNCLDYSLVKSAHSSSKDFILN